MYQPFATDGDRRLPTPMPVCPPAPLRLPGTRFRPDSVCQLLAANRTSMALDAGLAATRSPRRPNNPVRRHRRMLATMARTGPLEIGGRVYRAADAASKTSLRRSGSVPLHHP